MDDTDDLIPLRLVVPSEFRPDARASRASRVATHAYRDSQTDVSDGIAATDIIDMPRRRRPSTARRPPARSRAG